MIIVNNVKIKDSQRNLGWLMATTSAVSISYALQGFSLLKIVPVNAEFRTVAMCVTMTLSGFSICLLAELLKLYWVPYLECSRIGKTGKGRYLSGIFKDPDDYQEALARKDERIPFTILYGVYTFGKEVLNDFSVVGKYAECLWLVQGIIMTVGTKDYWHLFFAIVIQVIMNYMDNVKEISFDEAVKMTVPRMMKKSEK